MFKEIIYTLSNSRQAMITQLHEFCSINSGTTNLAGLEKMSNELSRVFKPIADKIQPIKMPTIQTITMEGVLSEQKIADALLVQKRPELKRRILLAGHMDTVFPQEHQFQQINCIDENTLNGPGVADMKGGLIVILHALNAFETASDAVTVGWDVLINTDEEIGSLASANYISKIAPKYQAALVYEPAMTPTGTLAKNRKGSAKYTLIAKGKSAHAGRDFENGRNAICYLAEAICLINDLNGKRKGVTINIGIISGGSSLNSVPDTAVAKIDIRIEKQSDSAWVEKSFSKILNRLKRPDYQLMLHGNFTRPVKKVNDATRRLFSRIQIHGKQLGVNIDWQNSGGCCDGNNLAQHELPVIDTLGVRGGNIHSNNEYILLDSLVERSALSSLLLLDLAQGGLEELTTKGKLE